MELKKVAAVVAHHRRRPLELIVNYQFRDRNRVLNLQRTKRRSSSSNNNNNNKTTTILSYCCCSTPQELIVSQARLNQVDLIALVRLIHHQKVKSLLFKACLLERIDVLFPLLQFCQADNPDCLLESICFTAVEVLMDEQELPFSCTDPAATSTTSTTTTTLRTTTTRHSNKVLQQHHQSSFPLLQQQQQHLPAHSCLVRPLLQRFPPHLGVYKLTLRNVDLAGEEDGTLLAQVFHSTRAVGALELYQSNLGPLGARQLCTQAMMMTTMTTTTTITMGIQELYLGYCSLDEECGVAELIRHLAHSQNSVHTLELHRNRSPPTLILNLLASMLKQSTTTTLRHLTLSDSPILFSCRRPLRQQQQQQQQLVDDDDNNNDDQESWAIHDFLQALQINQSLTSLKIVCCGLQSDLIGPLIHALAHRRPTLPFKCLRLSGSRLKEDGLIQLTNSLPLLPGLETLELYCSADGLTLRHLQNFVGAAQRHVVLTEFEGSGWSDDSWTREWMQFISLRNLFLQKSQRLLVLPLEIMPLGLWSPVLALLLKKKTSSTNTTAPCCGLSAAFVILQSRHAFLLAS